MRLKSWPILIISNSTRMIKRYQIKISGKVQGVGFRFSTYIKFDELGLTGKAENIREDRTVLVEAQGEEENLELLVEWCKHGPADARVDAVDVSKDQPLVVET